jgi:hypothetical protein
MELSDIIKNYLDNEKCEITIGNNTSDYIFPDLSKFSNYYQTTAIPSTYPYMYGADSSYITSGCFSQVWPTFIANKSRRAVIEFENVPTKRSIRCPIRRMKV